MKVVIALEIQNEENEESVIENFSNLRSQLN